MTKATFIAVIVVALLAGVAPPANAECMNKFVYRSEGAKQHVTLLTGKLTFQEALVLSKAIAERKSQPIEWVDDKGKVVARQLGELKAVRPMPVGCDDKASGVVLNAVFVTLVPPSKKMIVKFDGTTTVQFEEQAK